MTPPISAGCGEAAERDGCASTSATASSDLARCLRRDRATSCAMRPVVGKPGSTLLTRDTERASSRESVLAQLATAPRTVLETPSPTIGSFTDVEITLTMRPQAAARMPGKTACTSTWLAIRCLLNASRNAAVAARWAGPPGGPPVLLTRMCTGLPSARASTCARSVVRARDVGGDPRRAVVLRAAAAQRPRASERPRGARAR